MNEFEIWILEDEICKSMKTDWDLSEETKPMELLLEFLNEMNVIVVVMNLSMGSMRDSTKIVLLEMFYILVRDRNIVDEFYHRDQIN